MPLKRPCSDANQVCSECNFVDLADVVIDSGCNFGVQIICLGDGTFGLMPNIVARIRHAANQVLPAGADKQNLYTPVVSIDTFGMASGSALICKQPGYYAVKGAMSGLSIVDGSAHVSVLRNGALMTRAAQPVRANEYFAMSATHQYVELNVGDELRVAGTNVGSADIELFSAVIFARYLGG